MKMYGIKNIIIRAVCLILSAAFIPPFLSLSAAADDTQTLNVSRITEEQRALCEGVMLDSFENGMGLWSSPSGSAIYTENAFSEGYGAFEGTTSLEVSGTSESGSSVSAEITFAKLPDLDKYDSLAAAVSIAGNAGESAEYQVRVTVTTAKGTLSGLGRLDCDVWQVVYLPFGAFDVDSVRSVKFEFSALNADGSEFECTAFIDALHAATVCGMPENMPYLSDSFKTTRGSVKYGADSMTFVMNGSSPALESSNIDCILDRRVNAVAVTMTNAVSIKTATLYYAFDGAAKFTDTYSCSSVLTAGGYATYYFPIGDIKTETVLSKIKLVFNGRYKGTINIRSIKLCSYYFPPDYQGEMSVTTDGETISVKGSLPALPARTDKIALYRLLPGQDEESFEALDVEPYKTASPSAGFSFEFPAVEDGVNNTYYKYFVVYEGNNDIFVSTAKYIAPQEPKVSEVGIKGASELDSDIARATNTKTVYRTLRADELYAYSGDISFDAGGKTYYLNSEAVKKLDGEMSEYAYDEISVVLRLVFPPSEKEGYRDLICRGEGAVMCAPMPADADAASYFCGLVSFINGRYGEEISALIIGDGVNLRKNFYTELYRTDRAVKYTAELLRLACIAAPGLNVFLSVTGEEQTNITYKTTDRADTFVFVDTLAVYTAEDNFSYGICLECADGEVKSARTMQGAADIGDFTADNADALITYLKSGRAIYKSKARKLIITSALPDTCEQLAMLFYKYNTLGVFGICFDFNNTASEGLAELYKMIDTASGAALADGYFPESVDRATLFPNSALFTDVLFEECEALAVSLPETAEALYSGDTVDGWALKHGFRAAAEDIVAECAAVAFALDASAVDCGHAVYKPEGAGEKCTGVYFRIYADYLPAGMTEVSVRIGVSGGGVSVSGNAVIKGSEATCLYLEVPDGAAVIPERADIYVFGTDGASLGTMRLCVLGIYTSSQEGETPSTSAEETTKAEETAPATETPDSVTSEAEETNPVDIDTDGARLRVTVICVFIGMFILCGAVLFILDRRSRAKEKAENAPRDE